MNKTQRENLAKYSYDLSKLVFAAFVLANIMSEKFSLLLVIFGAAVTIVFMLTGFFLNKKQ